MFAIFILILVVMLITDHPQSQIAKQGAEGGKMLYRDIGGFYDPFHPFFIHQALQEQPWMKHLVFGSDSPHCPLLPGGREYPNVISELFKGYGKSDYVSDGLVLTLGTDITSNGQAQSFLDPKRSFAEEFNSSTSSATLNKWVDIKFYPGKTGTLALWTPLQCFPKNSYP
jgi:hypothetical protein